MSRHRRRQIAAAGLVVLLVFGAGYIAMNGVREPVYQGKGASHWLRVPVNTINPSLSRTWGVTAIRVSVLRVNGVLRTNMVLISPGGNFGDFDAFQAMGPDGWQFLSAAAHRNESWAGRLYRRLYAGWLHRWQQQLPDPGPPAESVRMRAIEILSNLRPRPTNLVATLYSLLTDPNSSIQDAAFRQLARVRAPDDALAAEIRRRPLQTLPVDVAFRICNHCKPPFDLVRPFIEGKLSSHNPVEREQALIAAQNCVRTPKTLERYAVTALHDPDYNVRYGAVYVLRDLGTNAAGALPDLRQTLTDEAAIVRNASERAIRAIQGVGPSAEDKLDEAASP